MEINKKILGIIMILYDIDNDTSNEIEVTLEKLSEELKNKILYHLSEAVMSYKKNLSTLSLKTSLIYNELEELKEKEELKNFKF